MSQIEELKSLVSERLHAAASDILGAIEKTITEYAEQASRLKEENERHRSLLDIILKAKSSPQAEASPTTKSTPAAANPGASISSPARKKSNPRETYCQSDLQCAFTSRTDFLKYAGNGDCPYCLKKIPASEGHLMRRHYLSAVHFNDGGTDTFVVPCTCKDLIQGRSHWHCSNCKKIIYRKSNFEGHISKQHGFAILQQSQGYTEIDQPSVPAFEEVVPHHSQPRRKQEYSSLHQEDQQATLLLQVKDEEEQEIRAHNLVEELVSHPKQQKSSQLQIEGRQIQKGNSQMCLEADHTQDPACIVCVDSYIQDLGEINSAESGKGHPPPNSSNQPLEMQPDGGVGGIRQSAGESQHTTPSSHSKRKKRARRSLHPLSVNLEKSAQPSVSQNSKGPYSCKACGKTFHYMYTLKAHAKTHAVDNIHICGICGKGVASTESLVQHIQSHIKSNKCGIHGKQFFNNSRMKRHKKFHRQKGLNFMSSAEKTDV